MEAIDIRDAGTQAAVLAATSQEDELAALMAPFVAAGSVVVKVYSDILDIFGVPVSTQLDAGTYPGWVMDSQEPRGIHLRPLSAYSGFATDVPTDVRFFAGVTEVFRIRTNVPGVLSGEGISFVDGVMPSTARANLSDSVAGPMRITATASLPVTNVTPPASPPQTTVLPVSVMLTPLVSGTVPFAFGHVFCQGNLASDEALDGLQTDVISTWPDGSTRFAVVSGTASMTSGTPFEQVLGIGTAATGSALTTADLKTQLTDAVVIDTDDFGSASWSGTDWDSPFLTWASGPVMSSWVYRKQIGSDAHLVGWLEVRLWSTGAVEVLPWIENGYLLVAGPTSKSATYTFTMGGTQRFSAAVDLPHHCRTVLVSGTLLSHWLGTDPGVVVKHDVTYLQASEMVPTYSATVSNSAAVVTGLESTYTPLQQGNYEQSMGNAGYQPSIGMLPNWDVLYLTCTSSAVWSALQRNAYSAGRYCIHWRDETTNLPARLLDHAHLCLHTNGGITDTGSSTTSTYTPTPTGTVPPVWDTQHHPSVGYMAALLTGRYYHVETIQFVAVTHSFKDSDNTTNGRVGDQGVINTHSAAFSHRGAGWALRSLGQAIAVSPAGDTRTELQRILDNNIDYYATRYSAVPMNAFGFTEAYVDNTTTVIGTTVSGSTTTAVILDSSAWGASSAYDDAYVGYVLQIGGQSRTVTAYDGVNRVATVSAFSVSVVGVAYELGDQVYYGKTWMMDFFNAAWGYIKALQPVLTSPHQANLDEFYAWNALSVVGRLGGIGSTEYLFRDAAQYTIALAPSDHPDWTGGTGPWFDDWGDIWTGTCTAPSPEAPSSGAKVYGDLTLRAQYVSSNPGSGYYGNMQPALAYAVRHGITGAQTGLDKLRASPTWAAMVTDWNNYAAEWSVAPPTLPLPAWVPMPGEAVRLTAGGGVLLNNFRDIIAPWFSPYYDMTIISDYSCAAGMPDAGTYGGVLYKGGGHSATNNGQVSVLRVDGETVQFVRLSDPAAWTGSQATDTTNQNNNSFTLDIATLVDPDWLDALSSYDSQPSTPGIHSFSSAFVIPHENGGAAKGTFIELFVAGGGRQNINTPLDTLGGSHYLEVTNDDGVSGNTWSRAGSLPPYSTSGWQGPLVADYVPEQNRVYYSSANASTYMRWFDRAIGEHVLGDIDGFVVQATSDGQLSSRMVYSPLLQRLMFIDRNSGYATIQWADVSVSSPTLGGVATLDPPLPIKPFVSGDYASSWFTVGYCQATNKIIIGGVLTAFGSGVIDDAFYEVDIPVDPQSTWTTTRRAITGTAAIDFGVATWQNPVWMPKLHCFILFQHAYKAVDGVQDSVIVYRPVGT